jgi:hypothetical protein
MVMLLWWSFASVMTVLSTSEHDDNHLPSSPQHDCMMDVATGECMVTATTTTTTTQERDPNLRLMTYDVGDGEQSTWVYVEPSVQDMYRATTKIPHGTTLGTELLQKVAPQFNGFAGKFINMSNKPCTLYWYVFLNIWTFGSWMECFVFTSHFLFFFVHFLFLRIYIYVYIHPSIYIYMCYIGKSMLVDPNTQ